MLLQTLNGDLTVRIPVTQVVRACLKLLFPVHGGKDTVPRNSTHILVIYFTQA